MKIIENKKGAHILTTTETLTEWLYEHEGKIFVMLVYATRGMDGWKQSYIVGGKRFRGKNKVAKWVTTQESIPEITEIHPIKKYVSFVDSCSKIKFGYNLKTGVLNTENFETKSYSKLIKLFE